MVFLVILVYFIPNIEIRNIVINVITGSWFIFTIIYILNIYYKKDKEYESKFKARHCKFIPNNRSPETLGFILDGNVKENHLLAALKELMRKKVILIGRFKDTNEYVLVYKKSTSMFLSNSEAYIVKWFFENVGNGEYVTFDQIKRESNNNSGYFNSCYRDYIELVNLDCARYNFFESKKVLLDNIFFYFFVSYMFVIYNLLIVDHYIIGISMFIITSLFLIYVNVFFKRTPETSREYDEWLAFKRWIKEDKNATREYNLKDLELCVVYAKLLHVNKYIKNLVCGRKDTAKSNFISCYKFGIIDDLDLILNRGIKSSALAMVILGRNKGISTSRKLKNDKVIEIIYERES